jgi:predicted O-methyltransferase YrrM
MGEEAVPAAWEAVDGYIVGQLVRPDSALDAALAAAAEAGLPGINVAPNQGKLLELLARAVRARRVLEIGTLGGYSTIWLARALEPGGHLVSLEVEERHAEVARANLARAGLKEVVEVRVGPALEALPRLAAEGAGPFDLVFIDADKAHNADYFEWALRMARRGSLIVVDNVVRQGRVLEEDGGDPDVVGTRRLFEAVASEPRVSATALQTVGVKGYDGFLLAVVTSDA